MICQAYPILCWLMLCLSIAFSAILTLSKVVLGTLNSNFDDSKDNEPHLRRIHQVVETPPFYEVISLGRLVANASSAILAFQLLRVHVQWTGFSLLDSILCAAIILHVLYVLVIFIPTLVGNLRPDSLARPTLFLFGVVSLPLLPPSKLIRKLFDKILARMGYDARLRFLTEDQREMLESDTSVQDEDSSLEEPERQMILNIFDFVETPVREIMTPRIDMLALSVDAELAEVVRVLNHERHSRVPVYRENMDNIVGILHNREFLHWYTEHVNEPFQLEKILKPAMFVPYQKKIDDLLHDFRRSGNQLALVVDEYGGTAGLVTLEDILEEIVGDIRDEDDHDEEQAIVPLKDGKYLVDPLISLGDLEHELSIHFEMPEDSHVETLSGLIQATLGSLPAQGTELTLGPCKVRVLKVDGPRMEKLLLQLTPPKP